MAEQKALALIDGKVSEIPLGDTIRGTGAGSGAENFSFHKIVTGKTVKIEAEQHMICTSLEIDGFLDVEGAVVML
jgi:hypothetical protein